MVAAKFPLEEPFRQRHLVRLRHFAGLVVESLQRFENVAYRTVHIVVHSFFLDLDARAYSESSITSWAIPLLQQLLDGLNHVLDAPGVFPRRTVVIVVEGHGVAYGAAEGRRIHPFPHARSAQQESLP